MGAAVARALVQAGFEVSAWNRTPERAAPLAEDGVALCATVDQALKAGDAVILMLLDRAAAEDALGGHEGLLAGKDVINLMTGVPEEAADLAEVMTAAGARYLDGAIECYPSDIAAGGAVINCSGDAQVWSDHEKAVKAIAGRSAFVGTEPGAANVLDAALAGTFHSVALGALCEAFSFLRASGIDPSRPEIALDYWLDFLKEEALGMAKKLEGDEFTTVEATLSVYLAAIRQWRLTMLGVGQRATLMTAHMHNLEIAEATGCGELGFLSQVTSTSIQRS